MLSQRQFCFRLYILEGSELKTIIPAIIINTLDIRLIIAIIR